MSIADSILDLVERRPGLTEVQLAEELFGGGSHQQRVNATCRRLVAEGQLERRGKGGRTEPFTYFMGVRRTAGDATGSAPAAAERPSELADETRGAMTGAVAGLPDVEVPAIAAGPGAWQPTADRREPPVLARDNTMKAFVFDRYGGPEVLHLAEVPKPAPGPGKVLIRVRATCVNPADWHLLRAKPFFSRSVSGWLRPKLRILGTDVAGVVELVGPGVSRLKPGDEVYADLSVLADGLGGYAEYAVASEERTALKPKALSFEEAGAMPMVGVTALAGLRKFGPIRPGQSVLVNGASGGVGHVAVQIAKAMGAVVTGVTSTRNLDFVRKMGADRVIDYTQGDFTSSSDRWDLVVDTIGNKSAGALRRVLTPEGKAAVIGFTTIGRLAATSLFGGRNVAVVQARGSAADLAYLAELADAGKVRPSIGKVYPFAELPAALARLETGRVVGKLAVSVGA